MKIEEHEKAYKEHLANIKKAIEEGIEENQRNIGYNISQGSVELLAIYLHKLRLLQGSGDQIDHRIFKSDNLIKKRIPFDFPSKQGILLLMKSIELERTALCYENRKPKNRINKSIRNFNELRKIINDNLGGLKNGKNIENK
ncbi:hypothetical protein HYW74_02070 [Candidatus Pacearchaeota archaeon]|nr:hypothetical protein [Candidatus Pacearchaeota archaeon]